MSKTDTYKATFKEEDAPGYNAIKGREMEIYADQEPVHIATAIPYELGGDDPLHGIDIFTSDKQASHLHYISMGFTNLFFDEKFAEDEINGFGFELTFRHFPLSGDKEKPMWPAVMLQNIARYVFDTGNGFDDYHYITANGPLKLEMESDITAMLMITDPEMKEINSPHGHLKFLQIFGITTQEYQDVLAEKYTPEELIERHKVNNPLLITDLNRK